MQNQSLELGAEPLEAGGPQIPYRRLLALRHQCVVAVSTSLNLKKQNRGGNLRLSRGSSLLRAGRV